MMIFNCCSGMNGRKRKEKAKTADFNTALKTLQIRLQHPVEPFKTDELKTTSFSVSGPLGTEKDSLNVMVVSHESPVGDEATEVAYEGGDEHEENASMKRDLSDFDLQSRVANSGEEGSFPRCAKLDSSDSLATKSNEQYVNKPEKVDEICVAVIQSGHVSDPGMGKAEFWDSPKLKRSCSNLETSKLLRKIANQLPPSLSQYSGELQELAEKSRDPGSPKSVKSHCSADRVMLKKHSSSQVLPSRSRKLWWKLFLWSHRNLHTWTVKQQPRAIGDIMNQQGGYSSDILEPNQELSKMQSPGSLTGESLNKSHNYNEDDNRSWDGFHVGNSGLLPQNQWVAFSMEPSPFARVDKWVKDLETEPPPLDNYDNNDDGKSEDSIVFLPSPARNMAHLTRCQDTNLSEETLHANTVIQSLNSSSTVAHISGIGLKAIPIISRFSSLRSVNLSNNSIVHIISGSLPKGLHTLNLSRNKISIIEGLRELTRLRILDLSYNRISRIGQGLSNCTIIKELYLAGNKMSDVEGLHRLLKLTVLDLSFNKITTTKALGQLVANYNSLQALNLLGNPIQSNISDDQLRKAICSLLPKLVYLNKQPIKPQRAREVLTDSVARAALGTSSSRSFHKRGVKRVTSSGSISSIHRGSVGGGQKSKQRSRNRTHHLKTSSSVHASSSR